MLRLTTIVAVTLLTACETYIDKSKLSYDGVVHRKFVSTSTDNRTKGPTCGGDIATEIVDPGAKTGTVSDAPRHYLVGPGDDLKFNIFGEDGMGEIFARVDAEGYVQLPIVEVVSVSGMTTRQIHKNLKKAYEAHFIEPWITVELANAESQPIYFLGEFREPGVKYLEFSSNLLEALAMANGLEEDAYLPGARLMRNEQVCTVDLFALLREGDFNQNIDVYPRDVIFAPLRADMRVYLLGAVASPQGVAFGEQGRSLLEVLSMVGGAKVGASLTDVRIIRSISPTEGELLIVNVSSILTGDALDLPLHPGDVVYVPNSPLGAWNMAIKAILPSLQLVGGIVTPIALIDGLLSE